MHFPVFRSIRSIRIIWSIFLVFLLSTIYYPLSTVYAQTPAPARIEDLNSVVGNILSIALALVGTASLVMLVIGGFQYFTAGDNKEGSAKARNTITYSLIGLILAVSAWLILDLFALFFFTSNPFGTFDVCLAGVCATP